MVSKDKQVMANGGKETSTGSLKTGQTPMGKPSKLMKEGSPLNKGNKISAK